MASGYLWDQPGVPHRGWEITNVIDCEECIETCEMCGKEEIRYIHMMHHPGTEMRLRVGCVCASKMVTEYDAKGAETWCRKRATWPLQKRWRMSMKGNPRLRYQGHWIAIFRSKFDPKQWCYVVDGRFSVGSFASIRAAMLGAYEALFPKPWLLLRRRREALNG